MSDTRTMTLTDFLLARIAEDKRGYFIGYDDRGGSYVAVDPAHLLAECEAKRRIVEACADVLAYDAEALPQDVLRFLALPYADHPDYREEWKP
jgi:fructoselysine-6-P-deglycase FrlB-like protein